jgi:hypothetical protein
MQVRLALYDNVIGDAGVIALAHGALTSHPRLDHIDVSANSIGDAGAIVRCFFGCLVFFFFLVCFFFR